MSSIVLFGADWCGHTRKFMPAWNRFFTIYNGRNDISVVYVDADDPRKRYLLNKYNIEGYPTVKFLPYGFESDYSIDYKGPRTYDGLVHMYNEIKEYNGNKEGFAVLYNVYSLIAILVVFVVLFAVVMQLNRF